MTHQASFHETFVTAVTNYSPDRFVGEKLWIEIEHAYSGINRHYHNLNHLDNLFLQLDTIKHKIENWTAIVLAIAYHDIVYNVLKQNNEEKSAELADKNLNLLVDNISIEKCKKMILATKGHVKTIDGDINYFIDADLSILGAEPVRYEDYTKQIRKEYSIFPDIIYRVGREKVIRHFLKMDQIYKTQWFTNKYETRARINLSAELDTYK